jgi:hypothetical protein
MLTLLHHFPTNTRELYFMVSPGPQTQKHTMLACDFSCSLQSKESGRDPLASASLTTCGLRFPGKAACGHYGMPRLHQHLQLRSLEPATDVRTPPMPPTTAPSRDFEPRAASHSANTMQNRTEMPIFLNLTFLPFRNTAVYPGTTHQHHFRCSTGPVPPFCTALVGVQENKSYEKRLIFCSMRQKANDP